MQFVKLLVAPANPSETPTKGFVQSQSAKIADAHRLAVDKSLARRDAACADKAIAFDADDGLMFGAFQSSRGKEIRFPLQRNADRSGHGIFAKQTAQRSVMCRCGQFKMNAVAG